MKTAEAPPSVAASLPLADLFEALRRDGFRLRPDDYVEVHQVLDRFQPQTPADLRALVAPLVVSSAEEQEKFDRIFGLFFDEKTPPPPPEPPKTPKPVHWGWWVAAGVVLLGLGYAAALWPMPDLGTTSFLENRYEGPYQVGDTLRFRVDSAVRRAAGPQVHWFWETPDGRPHTNEPEVAVVARQPGKVAVKLTVTRHEGLLVTGAYVTVASTARRTVCPTLPTLVLDTSTVRVNPLTHRYIARLANPSQRVQAVVWDIDGTVVARDRWQFDYTPPAGKYAYGGSYVLNLRAYPDSTQSDCYGEITLSRYVSGTDREPFTLNVRSGGRAVEPATRVKAPFRWLAWGLGALVLVLTVVTTRALRRKPPEPPKPTEGENPLARFVSDEPPLEIPLENRDAELVVRDDAFHQVVRTLRQRTEEQTLRLHIPRTLRATLREGGFPTLIFQPRLAEVEFLFLIDRSQVRSQQVALFEYLFRAFVRENVGIERFFFHQNFDRFTNENHPRGLTLRQITDTYRSRTLVVWGSGYPLLYPPYPVVEPAYRDLLAEFEHRAVLTSVPFPDWGSKERALQDVFLLLPADLTGQIRLMQAFSEAKNRQDAYLRQFSDEWYSLEYVDFGEVDELREYLGDEDLLQWLAAVALYPRLRWEVVVEMGRTLLAPERVNFTNLLRLVRIGWMHEGSLPDYTRFELLKILTPANEVKARETLLRMLDHAETYFPGEHFFDGEKYLLQTTNRFTLFAHDGERFASYAPAQRDFRLLRERGLLPDATTVRYLENDGRQWNTPIGRESAPDLSTSSGVSLSQLAREIDEMEAEKSRIRDEEQAAFQQGRQELASRLAVSWQAIEEQLTAARREWAEENDRRGRQRPISLNDYFTALPPDEPTPPQPPQPVVLTTRQRRLMRVLGFAGLALLATLIFMFASSRAQEVDLAQVIPLTVALQPNDCVTAANTSTTDSPRWTVTLDDSLVSLNNLRGTRAFTVAELQNSGTTGSGFGDETALSRTQAWFANTFRPAPDSLNLYVTLAVRDTGSAPAQSRFVALAGDTLALSIVSPDCFGEPIATTPTKKPDSVATQPVVSRLRVDVFYSEENQTYTQRIARKLAQGLRSSGQYDVQVKLLRTAMNQRPGYRVSGNEIRAEADERARAQQLKATAEAMLRTEKITFPLRGVTSNNRTPNYVSVFIVSPGAAGTAFVCQSVSPSWLARFNGAESPTRRYLYGLVAQGTAVQITSEDQASNRGVTTTTFAGTVRRICQQKGVYLVLLNGSNRALLARPGGANQVDLAIIDLNSTALDAADGQAYFNKLLASANFSTYLLPERALTANDAAQTAAPNDYPQTNAPTQSAEPAWRQLGRVQFANPSQDDWASLNELARNNPNGRLRVVIYCDEKMYAGYRDRVTKALPAAANRIQFENQPLDGKSQAYPRPYAEVFGSGIVLPASAK